MISLHSPPERGQLFAPTNAFELSFHEETERSVSSPRPEAPRLSVILSEFWAELLVVVGRVEREERGMGASTLWELPGTGNMRH